MELQKIKIILDELTKRKAKIIDSQSARGFITDINVIENLRKEFALVSTQIEKVQKIYDTAFKDSLNELLGSEILK